MPVVLNIDSEFNRRSAADAAREAERFYERRAAQLKVTAKLNEQSARKAGANAERILRDAAEMRVQAKLDERDARKAGQDARKIFADAGRDAGANSAVTLLRGSPRRHLIFSGGPVRPPARYSRSVRRLARWGALVARSG